MYARVKNIKNEKLFYPLDVIAIIFVIAVLAAVLVLVFNTAGSKVEIYVDGDLKYSYDLDEDRVVVLDELGHNVIVIKDGAVYMEEADCRNQLCVNHNSISKSGQQIVCLPNKVVVSIVDEKGDELDAIT